MSTEILWCSRCGQENPASAYSCSKCKRPLRPPSPEEKALMEISQKVGAKREGSWLGMATAIIGLLGLLVVGWWLVDFMRQAGDRMSAVQMTQLYMQGAFWALVVVGVLLAGILWVVSTRE